MKSLLITILVVVFLKLQAFPQSTNNLSQENTATIYMKAFANGDWDSIANLMHPEAKASIRGFIEIIPDSEESQKVLNLIWNVNNKEQAEALKEKFANPE